MNSNVALVIEARDNYIIIIKDFQRFYVPINNNHLEVFDILIVDGNVDNIDFEVLEGAFDFNAYLETKGVFQSISTNNIKVILQFPIRCKEIKTFVLAFYNDRVKEIISQLIFNSKFKNDFFQDLIYGLDIGHIFTIGTIHLYFLQKIFYRFLHVKFNHKRAENLSLILLIPLLFFGGFRFSVTRFFVFFIIKKFSEYLLKKELDRKVQISLFGIFVIIVNPYFVYSQTFVITFTILFFIDSIRYILAIHEFKYPRLVFLGLIQLVITPLIIFYNHYLNPLTWLLSFIMYPLSEFLLIIIPIVPFMNLIAPLIIKLLELVSHLSLKLYFEDGIIWGIIFGIEVIMIIYNLECKNKRLFKRLSHICILLLLFSQCPINDLLYDEIIFINVGQGDAILINSHHTHILVDTGGKNNINIGTEVIIPLLKKRHIYKLDALIISHDDFDHSGAKDTIIENFNVSRLIEGSDYEQLNIGSITINNLNRYCSYGTNTNDCSSVLNFNVGKYNFLLTGDISETIEKKIIKDNPNLKVDYLKLAHHGSKTSSSEEFLKALNPKEVIISVGKNNRYGHPSEEVLSRLNYLGITIRRTDKEGSIFYRYSFFDLLFAL